MTLVKKNVSVKILRHTNSQEGSTWGTIFPGVMTLVSTDPGSPLSLLFSDFWPNKRQCLHGWILTTSVADRADLCVWWAAKNRLVCYLNCLNSSFSACYHFTVCQDRVCFLVVYEACLCFPEPCWFLMFTCCLLDLFSFFGLHSGFAPCLPPQPLILSFINHPVAPARPLVSAFRSDLEFSQLKQL